jgi:tetratricopeptide (TPR) repeat protein
MENSLKNKKCHDVLRISNKYQISLSDKWDDGLYECAMKGSDFALAKKMANKHFKSKDLNERKKWLYRYVKVDFETGNYSDVLEASNDLVTLIEDDKKSQYNDVYRYLFDTYERLEQAENMLKSIEKINKIFAVNYKDLDRYVNVMNVGNDLKDNNIVIKYATIAYNIQKKSKAYPHSPGLEFALYQAYMQKEKYTKALEIIKSLNTHQMKKIETARQKYLLGSVYSKLWRDDAAINAYTMSIKADETSAWAKLAKSALEN